MGFPREIAKAQRASLAADIREAFDLVEPLSRNLNADDVRPHLLDLKADEFTSLRAMVERAKDSLFHARKIVEERPDH